MATKRKSDNSTSSNIYNSTSNLKDFSEDFIKLISHNFNSFQIDWQNSNESKQQLFKTKIEEKLVTFLNNFIQNKNENDVDQIKQEKEIKFNKKRRLNDENSNSSDELISNPIFNIPLDVWKEIFNFIYLDNQNPKLKKKNDSTKLRITKNNNSFIEINMSLL